MKNVIMKSSVVLVSGLLLIGLTCGCGEKTIATTKMSEPEKELFNKHPTPDQVAEELKMRTANMDKVRAAGEAAAEAARAQQKK